MRFRRYLLVAAILLLPAVAAPAASAALPQLAALAANSTTHSTVDLLVIGPGSKPVTIYEVIGGVRRQLPVTATTSPPVTVADGRSLGSAVLYDLAPWSCGSGRERQYVVSVDGLEAETAVRTRSCRRRFQLDLPYKASLGDNVAGKVTDTFKVGTSPNEPADVAPAFCVTEPAGGTPACQTLAFPGATSDVSPVLDLDQAGVWKVKVTGPEQTLEKSITVGPPAPPEPAAPPAVVFYGDSIMAQVGVPLDDGLPSGNTVEQLLRGGSGLFDPAYDWAAVAGERTGALHPRLSVVLLGGADVGWITHPLIGPVACCGSTWVVTYRDRVEKMLRALTAGGGRAVWVLNPAAGLPGRQPPLNAVESAVRQASALVPNSSVVDLGDTLSPAGVYVDSVGGTRVRADDGVHLSLAGADLAAQQVLAAVNSGLPPVNHPPVCQGTAFVGQAGVPRDFGCIDDDGDPITFVIERAPALGTVTQVTVGGTNRLRYSAAAGGLDSFVFHASDGKASSAQTLVTAFNLPAPRVKPPPVTPPNDSPAQVPCAGLKGSKLTKCNLDRKVTRTCGKLKGKKKSDCAKRLRALAKCDTIKTKGKKGKALKTANARKRSCVKKAKAIGKPARRKGK